MEYSFLPEYHAQLSTANDRTQPGDLALFQCNISLDTTHATISDSAVQQAREGFIREVFTQTSGQTIDSSGDWLFVAFLQTHEAVRASLMLKSKLAAWAKPTSVSFKIQTGIHAARPQDFGLSEALACEAYAADFAVCHRLLDLCGDGDILITQPAFDKARENLTFAILKQFERLIWANHGPFSLPELNIELQVGHIQPDHLAEPAPPPSSDTLQHQTSDNDPTVWGWRPAPATRVPRSRWVIDEKIRNGQFGEVWTAKEEGTPEKRMIECCFQMDVVELLNEQSETMNVVKRKITENRNVLRIFDISLDKPPYYIMFEHFEGKDLKTWASEKGGAVSIPFSSRLELVAQVASGLQGIFDAKVLHKTLTPEHILVAGTGQTLKEVQTKITNLGIGHIHQQSNQHPPTPQENHDAEDAEVAPILGDSDMYAAPELAAGKEPTVKSDIYSLGVILCQFVLGDLAEPVPPDRIQEIVTGLKREALIPFFAENPAERPATPGKIAQELRSFVKERETRSVESAQKSRRKMIELTVSLSLTVIALVVLAIFGPKYLRNDRATEAVPQTTPPEETEPETDPKFKDLEQPGGGNRGQGYDEENVSDSGNSSSKNPTRKNSTEKELPKPGIVALKYLGFPLCVVIVIGTLIRQLGPRLHDWFNQLPHSGNTD